MILSKLLILIIAIFSTVSAYSNDEVVSKSILSNVTVNQMIETEEPVLNDGIITSTTNVDSNKTIPTDDTHIELVLPQVTLPVGEEKIEQISEEISTPPSDPVATEIKSSDVINQIEVKTKVKENESDSKAKNTNPNMFNIVSTADGKTIFAQLTVTEDPQGILIEGVFKGVPDPGYHGIHIHEFGNCADKGNAAGGHFNPDNRQHGDLKSRGHAEAQAGDMGNVEIDAKGNGDFKFLLVASSLREGRYNIAGKSIILHEKADDLISQPEGNAGARIGCGIIPSF